MKAGDVKTAKRGTLGLWMGLAAELVKFRLSSMVLVTTAAGYFLAAGTVGELLLWTLSATLLVCFGAMALNERWEVELDRRMLRTRHRPLVTGAIPLGVGLWIGVGLVALGTVILAAVVNLMTCTIGLAIVGLYLLVYTPLKTRSPLCTLVGAMCGALPPMMGWAAARGDLDPGALVLGALLFVWQIPHFLALGWIYRDDYARAGCRMLSLGDGAGTFSAVVATLYALAAIPVSLVMVPDGAGAAYLLGVTLLGSALVTASVRWAVLSTPAAARTVFRTSLVYLPAVLALLLAAGLVKRPSARSAEVPTLLDARLLEIDRGAAFAAARVPPQAAGDSKAAPIPQEGKGGNG